MKRSVIIVLIVMMLTTGCSSYLPWSNSLPTSGSTDTTKSVNYPPGVDAGGITDVQQLTAAHRQTLAQSPYRFHARIRPPQRLGSSKWANSTMTGHFAGDRKRLHETGSLHANKCYQPPYTFFAWNSTNALRTGGPSSPSYKYIRSGSPDCLKKTRETLTDQITHLLTAGDYLYQGTTTRNGTTLHRFTTREVYYRQTPTGDSPFVRVQSLNASLLVDRHGMIHEFKGSFQPADSSDTRVAFKYTFWRVPEPPAKPPWINQMPHIRLTLSDAGILRIHHTGGATILGGTNVGFTLYNNSSGVRGTATLPEPLTPGETAYLTVGNHTSERGMVNGTLTVNRLPGNHSASAGVQTATESWVMIDASRWHVDVANSSTG